MTVRLTAARRQATSGFLKNQFSETDGKKHAFFGACLASPAEEFRTALADGKKQNRTSVVVVETSYNERVPGHQSWWDVPIAEFSERNAVKAARQEYEHERKKERFFFRRAAGEDSLKSSVRGSTGRFSKR